MRLQYQAHTNGSIQRIHDGDNNVAFSTCALLLYLVMIRDFPAPKSGRTTENTESTTWPIWRRRWTDTSNERRYDSIRGDIGLLERGRVGTALSANINKRNVLSGVPQPFEFVGVPFAMPQVKSKYIIARRSISKDGNGSAFIPVPPLDAPQGGVRNVTDGRDDQHRSFLENVRRQVGSLLGGHKSNIDTEKMHQAVRGELHVEVGRVDESRNAAVQYHHWSRSSHDGEHCVVHQSVDYFERSLQRVHDRRLCHDRPGEISTPKLWGEVRLRGPTWEDVCVWTGGWMMHACMHACMHGWMDGWMDGWTDGWMDG